MNKLIKSAVIGSFAAVLATTSAFAGTIKYFGDFDPIPLAAFEALIADFEAANPDIKVEFTNFHHEGYKTAIRNFLTADAPDVANWYAGNRMAPFVEGGQQIIIKVGHAPCAHQTRVVALGFGGGFEGGGGRRVGVGGAGCGGRC